jgi:hypothetical protein
VLSWAFSGRLARQVGSEQLETAGNSEHQCLYKQVVSKAAEPEVAYNGNGLPVGLPSESLLKEGWKWVKLGEVSKRSQYGLTEAASKEQVWTMKLSTMILAEIQ